MVNVRLREHIEGVEQSLRILLREANDLRLRRKSDCDLPGIEGSFEKIGVSTQAVTDQFQGPNLLGEGVVQNLQLVPVTRRLRIRIIAHHLHNVRLVLPVIIECGLGVLFRSLRSEVVPMSEWRTVYILPRQCPVDALFAGEWVSAGHLSQKWLCNGAGGGG